MRLCDTGPQLPRTNEASLEPWWARVPAPRRTRVALIFYLAISINPPLSTIYPAITQYRC